MMEFCPKVRGFVPLYDVISYGFAPVSSCVTSSR